MSDLGPDGVTMAEAGCFDTAALCNLMCLCGYFRISRVLVDAVKKTRNTWSHAPEYELSDAEKQAGLKTVKDLLKDPTLEKDADALKALAEIEELEEGLDFQSVESDVLLEAHNSLRAELREVNAELRQVKERVSYLEKETQKTNLFMNQAHRVKSVIKKNVGKLTFFPFGTSLRVKLLICFLIVLTVIVLWRTPNSHDGGKFHNW